MLKINKLDFNGNGLPEGIWGEYCEGVRLKIRKLTRESLRFLKKKHCKITMELDPRTRRMMPTEKIDDDAYEDAITDYLVEDFEGIGDADGNPLPLNLESKMLIMDKLSLREWIWSFAQTIEVAEAEKKEAEIKNS